MDDDEECKTATHMRKLVHDVMVRTWTPATHVHAAGRREAAYNDNTRRLIQSGGTAGSVTYMKTVPMPTPTLTEISGVAPRSDAHGWWDVLQLRRRQSGGLTHA